MTRLASLLARYLLAESHFPADLNALCRWAAAQPDADREEAAADERFLSRFGEVYPTLEGSRR